MQTTIRTISGILLIAVMLLGCKSMNKTQKGAVIGTAGGAAAGGVIGKAAGNTAMGAIIGAAVGGVTGAVIGRQMDKQAEEIDKKVTGAEVERVGEGIVVNFKDKILFGYDRSDLSPSAQQNMDHLTDVLKEYPDTNIEIQGHTDNKGSDNYNLGLSQRRAATVANYLRGNGIDELRINPVGYGETTPVADNSTDDGRAQNRRVTFLISANQKMVSEAREEAK